MIIAEYLNTQKGKAAARREGKLGALKEEKIAGLPGELSGFAF
jgi:hypothetical protein